MIRHCPDPNVSTRFSAAQVLAPHAWFANISLEDAMEGNLLPPYVPDVVKEGSSSHFIAWDNIEYDDRRAPKDPDYCDLSAYGVTPS